MRLDDENINDTLIINFLTGESSKEDSAQFQEKMESNQDFRDAFYETRRVWEVSYIARANKSNILNPDKAMDTFWDRKDSVKPMH